MCRFLLYPIVLLGPFFGCAHDRQSPTKAATKTDTDLYVEQSVERLKAQTAEHVSKWHLGDHTEWGPDVDNNCVLFAFADGTVAEAADVQIVGSYDRDSEHFVWGWTNEFADEEFCQPAHLAKQFGIDKGLHRYTEPFVHCTEDESREFLAVAARLAQAKGAYAGIVTTEDPDTDLMLFVTFGDVTVKSP